MRQPKPAPRRVDAVRLNDDQSTIAHMAASILLDYPTDERRPRFDAVRIAIQGLPEPVRLALTAFLDAADSMSHQELQAHFTATFDMKRRCCLYLSYFAAGDTRRRGMALVRFIEAYRAAGYEIAAEELPDYLPMVLEFSAVSGSPIARELLSSHRDGIEVLHQALDSVTSPYAHVLEAIALSLPAIDDATRARYLALVNEGPPTELVGVSFLGNLAPFSATAGEGVHR
jgi:nitrate reductase delta subunit